MPLKLLRSLIQENKEKMQEYPLLMGFQILEFLH